MSACPRFGVVVPIRTFALANTRLAAGLDDATRAELAARLAARVVRAAGTAPVVVVTAAPEVVAWASTVGATIVDDPGSLDGAAAAGAAALAQRGCRRVVVAHADLPWVTSYESVVLDADAQVATLVPCHHDDGTPVLSIPAGAEFTFSYGPGSFRRHVAAARAAGLGVRVVRDRNLAFDVDTIDDLAALERVDPSLLGLRPRPGDVGGG